MTVGILTEKPSAAKHFAAALGGSSGTYNGTAYVIASARGHLYEFVDPSQMVEASLSEKYRKWGLDNLPWDPAQMNWKLAVIDNAKSVAADVKRTLSGCDEIVIATDVDPTGEGGMIAVNAFLELGLQARTWSRMYFTDEAPASLQKAFTARKQITSLTDFDEYKKASYRSRFDLLSMQFTRVATNMAHTSGQDTVLRQGRLKSWMVKAVGDQLQAHKDYVRKPYFQNRFRDENGVVYTDPEEARHDTAAQVPQTYGPSPVVCDSKADKTTSPPRLLDLATLSSMLVGEGIKAKQTLETYQKMYEAQVVSYPRTEDKTITPEQFKELSPLVDRIASVVGVDPALLVHREPRGTHVKPQGAHGANRPGPSVPGSLDEVERSFGKAGRLIYATLAKNYLAMLADDYRYEQQKGHVEKYPSFVGVANVAQSQGWRLVFDPDAGSEPDASGGTADGADGDAGSTGTGLGSNAEPFVYEGANKRPEHPTMKWLMKQMEKHDVGTGATRTSTYSEVTNAKAKYPLMSETGRKVTLAKAGEMSWLLLPETHIGGLKLTEKVYADMRDIAAGTRTAEECLAEVATMVREDIVTMTRNAATMRERMGLSEVALSPYATGVWAKAPGGPVEVRFKRIFSGHEFTDAEVEDLLKGETVSFQATSSAGRPYTATGALGVGTFKNRKYVGFQLEVQDKPTSWSGHTFTDDEVARLLAGEAVTRDDFFSQAKQKRFGCKVRWDATKKKIEPDFGSSAASGPPTSWCAKTFTAAERADLAAGKKIFVKGFTSKAGKRFDANIEWKDDPKQKGRKTIVPSFK